MSSTHTKKYNQNIGYEYEFENHINKNNNLCNDIDIDLSKNIFVGEELYKKWEKYNNVDANALINTFRYMFYKFKKGIFIKIVDNKLDVFVSFSNKEFKNEWSHKIKINPKYKNLKGFITYMSNLQGYRLNEENYKTNVNTDIQEWYSNNCLIRYDFTENDTNVEIIQNMFEELCKNRKLPNIEFFINRRDFPILTRNGYESYNHIWDTYEQELVSHKYNHYLPILSMSTNSSIFSDIVIPTYEDWARVKNDDSNNFPSNKTNYNNYNFNKVVWDEKIPIAVFRGSSTGCGLTIETNARLKLAYLSSLGKRDFDDKLFLNAGITKWQTRCRKLQGEEYLETFDIDKLPDCFKEFDKYKKMYILKKIDKLTPEQQSNYKYIVNIDGNVSAFRLSLELNMKSVILIVDSELKMWFKNFLEPWVHYVPISADLGDIYDKIKWCKKNDEKCKIIVKNAQDFYDKFLKKDGIYDYMQKILIDLKKDIGTYLYNVEDPLTIQINNELKSFSYKFPNTDKTIKDINEIPNIERCYGKLQGIELIINMIISSSNFEDVAIRNTDFIFKNKLSTITKWSISNFDFVLKKSNDKQKMMENIHEAYIGINSINELSKLVPNFAYIFGYYTKDETSNVIVEYIEGETLLSYIKSKNFKMIDFLIIIVQLCLALQIAHQKCAFVHWDLTPWNIIIKKLEKETEIDYFLNPNKVIKVKTKYIPVIIDYGKSHTIIDDIHYGFINMFSFNSVQDVITLLIKSVQSIIIENEKKIDNKLDKYKDTLKVLMKFLSKTEYTKNITFIDIESIKSFVSKAGKYSSLISDNKYELNNKTPIDFVNLLYNKIQNVQKFILFIDDITNITHYDKSNSTQVFEYILSETQEERLETYFRVFEKLSKCDLPLSKNFFINYYAIKFFENHLLSVKNDMLLFIKNDEDIKITETMYNLLLEKIHKKYKIQDSKYHIEKFIEKFNKYNQSIESPSYTSDLFLNPTNVLEYIENNTNIINVTDYIDVIEYVLINYNNKSKDQLEDIEDILNELQIGDEEFSDYKPIELLEIINKKCKILVNNANIKTLKLLSKQIYSENLIGLPKCEDTQKYIDIYNKIINII